MLSELFFNKEPSDSDSIEDSLLRRLSGENLGLELGKGKMEAGHHLGGRRKYEEKVVSYNCLNGENSKHLQISRRKTLEHLFISPTSSLTQI